MKYLRYVLILVFVVSSISFILYNFKNQEVYLNNIQISEADLDSNIQEEVKISNENKIAEKKIQVLYYFKETYGNLCSGLKEGFKVKTVRHCISTYDLSLENERVMYDNNVLSENVILRTDLTIKPNDRGEFSIATADKGIVGAVEYAGGCQDDECNFYSVKAYKILGQGNSGSPVFDSNGNYAGALSLLQQVDIDSCDEIRFEHPRFGEIADQDRKCSYYVTFATSEGFRKKIQ